MLPQRTPLLRPSSRITPPRRVWDGAEGPLLKALLEADHPGLFAVGDLMPGLDGAIYETPERGVRGQLGNLNEAARCTGYRIFFWRYAIWSNPKGDISVHNSGGQPCA